MAHVIEHLDGISEINFVAHSLGNIVVRHYLGDQSDPQHGRRPDGRIRRFVMLGPPNQGSIAATTLADNMIFRYAAGPSGQQLGAQWAQIQPHLVTPACEFGIIAGGRLDGKGFNPLLSGDNDGLVTVESTKLAGAADFLVVPVLHSSLVDEPRVMQLCVRFLEHGYFVSESGRQLVR